MVGRSRVLLALVASFALAGCASLPVGSDYDREVSFDARETYDWVGAAEDAAQDVDLVNPFIDRRLRRAVENELESRGYRRVEEGPVDVLVSVSVLDAEEAAQPGLASYSPLLIGLSFGFWPAAAFYYPGYGFGYGYGRYSRYGYGYRRYSPLGYYRPYFGYAYGGYSGYGYFGGSRMGNLDSMAPGTFFVDIIDGETGELIWRGWANGALSYAPDVEELPQFIASVVHKIMEEFPPKNAE